MLIVVISAYPLFKFMDYIGIIIWLLFFVITFGTAIIIERFKKTNDIQTYKEILAFIDGKQLTYEEQQQEIGKRLYQKIVFAFLVGIISIILSLIVIFIVDGGILWNFGLL